MLHFHKSYHIQGVPKKVSIKIFILTFTASIHSFWIYLDSVYLYVLFGISFNRLGRIQVKLQQFFGDVCVF